jgi:hypothetical protein
LLQDFVPGRSLNKRKREAYKHTLLIEKMVNYLFFYLFYNIDIVDLSADSPGVFGISVPFDNEVELFVEEAVSEEALIADRIAFLFYLLPNNPRVVC